MFGTEAHVHIGTDEVPVACWKSLKTHASANELFHLYIGRVVDLLHKRGKVPIMWDEAIATLPPRPHSTHSALQNALQKFV